MGVLPAKGPGVCKGEDISRLTLKTGDAGHCPGARKRELFGSMPVEDNLVLGGYRQMRLRKPCWRDQLERKMYQRFCLERAPRPGRRHAVGGERLMLAVAAP